jgi:hypothetical protein
VDPAAGLYAVVANKKKVMPSPEIKSQLSKPHFTYLLEKERNRNEVKTHQRQTAFIKFIYYPIWLLHLVL